MQPYTRTRYNSRNIDIGEEPLPCELCLYNLINGSNEWVNVWVDINHLSLSYRGKRKHNKDGTDIILMCRKCHEDYHNHINNISQYDVDKKDIVCYDLNKEYLEIVKEMITVYSSMWHKEKLWKLVEILHSKNMRWHQKSF